jgi:branched-chain amino acid transport system permease protein
VTGTLRSPAPTLTPAPPRPRWQHRTVPVLAAGVALALYPVVVRSSFGVTLGVLALIAATAATGWNILGGYTGQWSFAHGVYTATGMYVTALAVRAGCLPWTAMPAAALAAAVLAVLLGWPCFRLSRHIYAVATFTLSVIAMSIATNLSVLGGAQGLSIPLQPSGVATLQFDWRDPTPYYVLALGVFALATVLSTLFLRGRTGRYLAAIRDDQDAAAAAGVPVRRYKLAAAAVSAALTSLAGCVQVMVVSLVDPTALDVTVSTSIAVTALLGGAGTAWGPLVGGWALTTVQEVSRTYLSVPGRSTDTVLYGALIILIALALPDGLIGGLDQALRRTLRHLTRPGANGRRRR